MTSSLRPALADHWCYALHDECPRFLGCLPQGNLAPYGWVLWGSPDDVELRQYLLEHGAGGLWEWDVGRGATLEDTAIVLEGLIAAGVDAPRLRPSLDALVRAFWDGASFHTVRGGRAAYWDAPSVDAAALMGYLLAWAGVHAEVVEGCARFLASSQEDGGGWRGMWFPSRLQTTWYGVRFLRGHGKGFARNVERALSWVEGTQREDGSWNGRVIDTAAAVLVLDDGAARDAGRRWLRGREGANGWAGEAVLYYWMDAAGPVAGRVFCHAQDRGAITSAWARAGLRGG